MKKKRFKLCLQFFNEGFASGGEAGGTEGSANGFADLESNQDEPEIVYGIQQDDDSVYGTNGNDAAVNGQSEQAENSTISDYNSFKAKYKAEIGKEIQDAIARRFKNHDDVAEQLQSLNDALGPMYAKYGLKYGDVAGIAKAISEDDTLYDELADQHGMSSDAYREHERMVRENERFRENERRAQASAKAKADYEGWVAQADELKSIYPNFDLTAEVQNPDFIADLKAGKSVRKAYEAAHLDEILSGAVQATAQNVRKAVTDSIAARGMRPAENGSKSRPGVVVKNDVNSLTDKDIDQILRQVKAGKKIAF